MLSKVLAAIHSRWFLIFSSSLIGLLIFDSIDTLLLKYVFFPLAQTGECPGGDFFRYYAYSQPYTITMHLTGLLLGAVVGTKLAFPKGNLRNVIITLYLVIFIASFYPLYTSLNYYFIDPFPIDYLHNDFWPVVKHNCLEATLIPANELQ